jgi:hypothetical protein
MVLPATARPLDRNMLFLFIFGKFTCWNIYIYNSTCKLYISSWDDHHTD